MAIQSSGLSLSMAALSARLLEEREVSPRARITAQILADALPGSAVNVYAVAPLPEGDAWAVMASAGAAAPPEAAIPLQTGTLGILARDLKPLLFDGRSISREDYAHVNVRRTLRSLCYLPLTRSLAENDALIGTIEILSFENALSQAQMNDLGAVAEVFSAALFGAQVYENEHHNTLESISRLTQLYDIEKVFSSTLEMDQLFPIIGSKVREMLECEAVNLWLLEADESLRLMHQSGDDFTVRVGALQKPGEGVPGDVSDNGEAVLIERSDDERLVRRNLVSPNLVSPNAGADEGAVTSGGVMSLIVAPIMDQESLVGVIEAVNKLDGSAFDDDELFTLSRLTESAAIALHNASLLAAERKVEILETLVTVSHEITSTLNLERMLQTIVNAPQAVIPYERAAVALEHHGKYKLSAVTGVAQLDSNAPEIAPLNNILRWALLAEEVIHVKQHGDEISDSRPETQAKFGAYFEETGMRGFYATPLSDDTGRVGILGLESSDPDFLSTAHLEILQVLAGQATVALRNAQMYKEVPFISVLEPVLERKRKFMALEKRRRTLIMILAAAAVFFLAACPLPLRLDGDAVIAPAHSSKVQPEVEGVVSRVLVHEGDQVRQGQVIAELQDWEYRSALGEAQAKYETALLHMNRALAGNDGSEAGIQRVQADYWKSEVDRASARLEQTKLRSPINGTIATPHVEDMTGRRLQYGDSFVDVVDTSRVLADVAIDYTDTSLLRVGAAGAVKLNSYPTRTFRGVVEVVSPVGVVQGESRVFFARVAIPNADGAIRAGMEGRGKVSAGWYPAGYVIFRHAGLWIYSHVWDWFGL
jgi:RND family efflux transporter MFP subunit